jgi:toxin ParE1/3/4
MAAYRQTARAEQDLIDIWLAIAADNPAAADMVLDTLDAKARMLAGNPNIGVSRDDIMLGLRYFPWRNYLIFYHVADDTIEVYRYIHGARDYMTFLQD